MFDKYYVKSGDLNYLVTADNSFDACCKALKNLKKITKLDIEFSVNRRGFVSLPEEKYSSLLIAEAIGYKDEEG